MLGNHRDPELPEVELLVVCRGDEATASFDECDGVDGTQMFLVLLHDLTRVDVELHNLFVGAPSQKQVLLDWMEAHAVWSLLIREGSDHLARLCVPQLDGSVEPCAQELGPIVGELDVPDGLRVASVGSEAFASGARIPDFAGAVITR
eukprot:CAMPEP_0170495582 /NCGR_PEP_ID=MMETSP0208-20121228/17288_1 /TAXON_ID=197538 /ORGANISM="Strombidium inclinatum, Strain S3" /LENGTH=147 /DNA_ID=CAMNT_0010771869 /DNA_START=323 /DNA_END=766 /DNA_ORIENTATION=-